MCVCVCVCTVWILPRKPKFGRDLSYHYPSCDLYAVGAALFSDPNFQIDEDSQVDIIIHYIIAMYIHVCPTEVMTSLSIYTGVPGSTSSAGKGQDEEEGDEEIG